VTWEDHASRIKVLVRDPENLQFEILMLALDRRMGFEVIEDDGTGEPVLLAVQRRHVDVVVADLDATRNGALTLARELARATRPVPLVVVTQPAQPERVKQALRAGAKACVGRGEPANELYLALRAAVRGEIYVSEELGGIPAGW
jgi:DNA-binding NarL/FixJ family response regulator